MLKQALILAGGLGTRLGKLTQETPKPLLPVNGIPFLEYIVWNLKRHGIQHILLSTGYLSEKIIAHFGDGKKCGLKIDYLIEHQPLGTGGAVTLAADKLEEKFLILNGDTLFDFNYLDLHLNFQQHSSITALALRQVADTSRYGKVLLNDHNEVLEFSEKSQGGEGYVYAGVNVCQKDILNFIPQGPCSLEKDVFPQLVQQKKMIAKSYEGFFIDIGIPDTFKDAQTSVVNWKKKPAVFLDRDGVLNIDKGYVHRSTDFEWVPGAVEAIKYLNDKGYLVFVVTNQAGIARGYYSEKDFLNLSKWMNTLLMKDGAHLDAIYYCPHHPVQGVGVYLQTCKCRKPNPGMLKQAMQEWSIDMKRSFLVGDMPHDVQAAERANIKGYLFNALNLYDYILKLVSTFS